MGSVSPLEFFGGATNITISADTPLHMRYRFWRVTNTGASSVEVTFPPTSTLGLLIGAPSFIIANVGSVAFNYRDFEDVLPVLSLPAGKAIMMSTYLLDPFTPQWAVHTVPFAFNYTSY